MNHKTTEALQKLKDVELEILRLRNTLDMMNKTYEAKKEWQGLTDEEIYALDLMADEPHWDEIKVFARSIETKLKEKNDC